MKIFTITFALAIVIGSTNGLRAQKTPMTSADIAKLRNLGSAEISPDGEYVAYTKSVPRRPMKDDDGSAWSELHVSDLQGNSRPFITGKVSIGHPYWSADSKWIFYTAKRSTDKDRELYRIAVDGGESLKTFDHKTSIGAFDISKDQKQVAFLATEEKKKDLKEEHDDGFDQEIYEEDSVSTRIWIADIDTAGWEPDHAKPRMLDLPGSAIDVKWSPDASQLMVVLAPTPSVDDSYMKKQVHVVDVKSGKIVFSAKNPGKLGKVAWSPDGKKLAMISAESINDPKDGRLMVIPTSGGALKELMPEYQAHVSSFAWKDDKTLFWLAGEGVASRFGTVTTDGKRDDIFQPSDVVMSSFSFATNSGNVVFTGESASHPAELFVESDGDQPLKRITDSNPWLANIKLAKQERITWKGRDGLELEGVLMYPLDYEKGKRYPTIMLVHGGPESHEKNGWITGYSRPGQVAAAKGFVVFHPNYRGSTGRGVKFSQMGQSDSAGKEFDDLVDGIDHLIELGITDKDRVGVTGGSYGGYASAWCSTFYSDRFAASVMFVGISDKLSKAGTTDIPEEMYLVHQLKRVWDDWDYFIKRSPIRYVERNKTPTLILHGKNDPRVHPSQSLELHRHLKTLDQAPVRLVLYEGEGHGNRKAAARLDYNLRMLRWMQTFLQDDAKTAPEYRIDYRKALGIESKD